MFGKEFDITPTTNRMAMSTAAKEGDEVDVREMANHMTHSSSTAAKFYQHLATDEAALAANKSLEQVALQPKKSSADTSSALGNAEQGPSGIPQIEVEPMDKGSADPPSPRR